MAGKEVFSMANVSTLTFFSIAMDVAAGSIPFSSIYTSRSSLRASVRCALGRIRPVEDGRARSSTRRLLGNDGHAKSLPKRPLLYIQARIGLFSACSVSWYDARTHPSLIDLDRGMHLGAGGTRKTRGSLILSGTSPGIFLLLQITACEMLVIFLGNRLLIYASVPRRLRSLRASG